MSYITEKDWLVEVAQGNVPGASLVHKFGRNDAVPNASFELVSMLSAATTFLSAATKVRIKAGGNINDTVLGTGAREVTVQGIASDLTETSEAIATAGASASTATTASFWRVYRAWVSSAGAYGGSNTGDVTIEDSGGSADINIIKAGEGQTQFASYSIPTAKTGYLLSVHVTVDTTQEADIRVFTRESLNDAAVPMPAKRLKLYWDGIKEAFTYTPRSPELVLPALTDIWVEAQGAGGATQISVDFEILLIDD